MIWIVHMVLMRLLRKFNERIGPRWESWGTPDVASCDVLLIDILLEQLIRTYFWRYHDASSDKFNRRSLLRWSTLSNALLKSVYVTSTFFLLLRAFATFYEKQLSMWIYTWGAHVQRKIYRTRNARKYCRAELSRKF